MASSWSDRPCPGAGPTAGPHPRWPWPGALAAVLLALAALGGCRPRPEPTPQPAYRLWLTSAADTLYTLHLAVDGRHADSIVIRYPIYRLDTGDLTGDGRPEVALGVVKTARYWPEPDRRLFIYHLHQGRYIRPRWLGSRVGDRLIDFRIARDTWPARVQTIEQRRDSTMLGRQYRLAGFGLRFDRALDSLPTLPPAGVPCPTPTEPH